MSESIEAFVRRAYEKAWNAGDLESLFEIATDDIVFISSGSFPDHEREYRGQDQVRRLIETLRAPFEQLDIQVEHVVQRGERILALFHFRAEGREGLVLNTQSGHVSQMRDRLVNRIDAYPDWESAAAAFGIEIDEM